MGLTASGTIYLIFSLLTFYMAGAYRSRALMGVAIAALLLFAILLIQLCVTRSRLQLKLPDMVSTTEEEQLAVSVSVVNRTPFSSAKTVLLIRTGYAGFPKSFRRGKIFFDAGPRENTVTFALTPVYAGQAEILIDSLQIADLFGFFRIRKKIRKTIGLTVLPQENFSENADEPEQRQDNLQEEQTAYRRGDDGNEIFQIREYRSGDPLRRVHWNLSARMERLLIREPGDTKETIAEFFLRREDPGDFSSEKETNQYLKKRADFYQTVSSEIREALLQADLVRVHLNEEETVDVRRPEDIPDLMTEIYEAGVTAFAGNLSETEKTES